jgi:hypothetical protein
MSTKTVCDTQDDFNHAFRDAIKYVEKKNKPRLWVQIVAVVIIALFILWALMLACKVGADQKLLHYLLAMVFSPFYIISYYLSASN